MLSYRQPAVSPFRCLTPICVRRSQLHMSTLAETSKRGSPLLLRAHRQEADSFYHLAGAPLANAACQGTACFVAGHLERPRWGTACAQSPRVYCVGKCYAAPAAVTDDISRPPVAICSSESIVTREQNHLHFELTPLPKYINLASLPVIKGNVRLCRRTAWN
jgi:hypothetical protein